MTTLHLYRIHLSFIRYVFTTNATLNRSAHACIVRVSWSSHGFQVTSGRGRKPVCIDPGYERYPHLAGLKRLQVPTLEHDVEISHAHIV